MADAVLVRLGQEELVYLLRALGITNFPGLGPQPLGELDEDHQALALAVVDRTLRARGMVRWSGDDDRSLDPMVAGMLRACAGPAYTLLVTRSDTAQPQTDALYSFSDVAMVEQAQPEPGIHAFLATTVRADAAELLHSQLALDDESATPGPGSPGLLTPEQLARAIIGAPRDRLGIERALAGALPQPTAAGLAEALSAPRVFRHVALWQGAPGASPDQAPRDPLSTLTVAQGATGALYTAWQGPSTGLGGPQVEVAPATPAFARQQVERLIQPALAALPSQ